ncbi:WhiB family transcriptional regulator [Nocardioides sp. 31GB23]|uniref:WhiB family transcriptional regulator n=1 Tax=Nocardioides sp. 31GB23 TaxID=3156065 RepID=UPI0032AFB896
MGRRQVPCVEDPGAWSASRKTPAEAARQDEAREACGWCPVLELCRAYAVAAREPVGVWGGLNERERREVGR